MSWHDNKIEMSVLLAVSLLLGGMFYGFRSMQHKTLEEKDLVYEMPRPNSFTPGEYDLSQREVERRYVNPFEKIAAKNNLPFVNVKKGEKAKSDAQKRNASTGRAISLKSKPKMMVNVVDRSKNGLSASARQEEETFSPPSPIVKTKTNEAQNTDNVPNDDVNTDRRSFEQWRSLLRADPSYENMRKLMRAVSEKEVDSEGFNQICSELMDNQNVQAQNVGLYGIQGFPSSKGFATIVHKYDLLQEKSKKFADDILMAYNQPQQVGYLNAVLQSKDEMSIMKAGEVILAGIEKFRSGASLGGGGRNQRGDVKIKSASQYLVLIPTLQRLSSTAQGQVSQLANTVISQIQSVTS